MLAVYIQYKYIYITKCQLNLLIGIGYILPTFGEDAQGRGMYIFRYEYALYVCCQHLGSTCQLNLPIDGQL